jgi:hypothetical protein
MPRWGELSFPFLGTANSAKLLFDTAQQILYMTDHMNDNVTDHMTDHVIRVLKNCNHVALQI